MPSNAPDPSQVQWDAPNAAHVQWDSASTPGFYDTAAADPNADVGMVEAGAHYLSGAIAPFAGGLTYLGTLAATLGNTDAAKAVKDATESAVTYQPRTPTGQAAVSGIDNAVQTVTKPIGAAVDAASDRAADLHGPLAGAFEQTVLQGAPYVLGLGGEMSAARGVSGAARATQDAITGAGKSLAQPAPAFAGELPPTPAPAAPEVAPALIAPPKQPIEHTVGGSAANPPRFEEAPAPTTSASDTPSVTLPPEIQAQRAATLKDIGLKEARESAVTGDAKGAATDYQQSKIDGEGGETLSNAFSNERAALDNYSDKLVGGAGGSLGLDETSLYNRGQTVLQPLQDLADHYDSTIKQLYGQADSAAKGMPLELNSTSKVLANRPEFIGTTEGQQLLRGANAYLRQAGVMDDAGTVGNATVQQAELFKQYLNNQWSPRTARLIRGMKDAIDDDVTQSAGGDVYGQARAARAQRANLLDNPTGISSLLDSSGPEGINRAVNVERVPDTVARMPVDQFGHVVDTLEEARKIPTISDGATAAINELRSNFMLRMQEQAQKLKGDVWNNRGASQYLNANSAKLARVFTPAELRQIQTLNDAGNILDVNRAYPGAAVQGHNLAARGAIKGLQHGGALIGEAVGSTLGAPGVGTFVGGAAGKVGARVLENSLSKKAAKARIRTL
jgi:hypothetical protein